MIDISWSPKHPKVVERWLQLIVGDKVCGIHSALSLQNVNIIKILLVLMYKLKLPEGIAN